MRPPPQEQKSGKRAFLVLPVLGPRDQNEHTIDTRLETRPLLVQQLPWLFLSACPLGTKLEGSQLSYLPLLKNSPANALALFAWRKHP